MTITCVADGKQIHEVPSVSDGYTWTVPSSLFGVCAENVALATFSWQKQSTPDMNYRISCDNMTLLQASSNPEPTLTPTSTLTPISTLRPTSTSTPTPTESGVPSGTTGVNITAAVSGTVATITFVGIIVFVIIIRRKRRRMSYDKQRPRADRESDAGAGDDKGTAKSLDSYNCNMYEPSNTRTHNEKISKSYSNSRTDGGVAMKELSSIPIPPHSGVVPRSRPSHRQDRLDMVCRDGDGDGDVFRATRNGSRHNTPTSTARNPQLIGHRSQPRDHGHYAGLRNAERPTDALYVQSTMSRVLALTASASAPGNPHIILGNPQVIDYSSHPNEQERYTDPWNRGQSTDTLAPTFAADFVMSPTSGPGNPHAIPPNPQALERNPQTLERNPQALERNPEPNDQNASDLAATSATAFALAILTEPTAAPGNPHAMEIG